MLPLCCLLLLLGFSFSQAATFVEPTNGTRNTNCEYGDTTCATSSHHTGEDFGDNNSLAINASNEGKVVHVENMSVSDHGMGTNIIIEHQLDDGSKIYTSYSHLSSVAEGITEGTCVSIGQNIGTMGESGYGQLHYWSEYRGLPNNSNRHLHFEFKHAAVTCSPWGGSYWGYTPTHPDNYGYANPYSYINVINASTHPDCSTNPQDNSLVRIEDQDPIYWLQNGKAYHVVSFDIINAMSELSGWGGDKIYVYPEDVLEIVPIGNQDEDTFEQGPDFISTNSESNGLLIQLPDDPKVYLIEEGERRWITTENLFVNLGYNWDDVIVVTQSILNLIPEGEPMSSNIDVSLIIDSSGSMGVFFSIQRGKIMITKMGRRSFLKTASTASLG